MTNLGFVVELGQYVDKILCPAPPSPDAGKGGTEPDGHPGAPATVWVLSASYQKALIGRHGVGIGVKGEDGV